MKKLILASLLAAASSISYAEIISDLDEVAMLGTWNIIESEGSFSNLHGCTPLSITFNDGKKSYFKFNPEDREPYFYIGQIIGYWIGGSATGKYTLHFFNTMDYDGSGGWSLINFVISDFRAGQMTLQSYDGTASMTLVKEGASVNSLPSDDLEGTVVYDINGIEVDSPTTPGVYVRSNGEKFIIK